MDLNYSSLSPGSGLTCWRDGAQAQGHLGESLPCTNRGHYHIPVWQTVCLTTWLPACLPACLHDCLSACLPHWLSDYLTVCMSDCMTVCRPDCLSECLSNWHVCPSVSVPVCLTMCPTVFVSLTGWWSIFLFDCLSDNLTDGVTVCMSLWLPESVCVPSIWLGVRLTDRLAVWLTV